MTLSQDMVPLMFDGMIAKVARVTVFKSPLGPNVQSAKMAQNVSNAMYFKAKLVCKIPLGGGGNKRVSGSGTI